MPLRPPRARGSWFESPGSRPSSSGEQERQAEGPSSSHPGSAERRDLRSDSKHLPHPNTFPLNMMLNDWTAKRSDVYKSAPLGFTPRTLDCLAISSP